MSCRRKIIDTTFPAFDFYFCSHTELGCGNVFYDFASSFAIRAFTALCLKGDGNCPKADKHNVMRNTFKRFHDAMGLSV